MTDSTPPVLAALERQVLRLRERTEVGLPSQAKTDAELLQHLRAVLSRAIVRRNELDPITQSRIAAMLDGGA